MLILNTLYIPTEFAKRCIFPEHSFLTKISNHIQHTQKRKYSISATEKEKQIRYKKKTDSTTSVQTNGQTSTKSGQTDTTSGQRVLRVDRRVDRRVLRVHKRVLRVDKRVLRVDK